MREVAGERAIVMAIHPRYAARIYAGEKTAELRRASPSSRVRMAFIYETAPASAITGVMLVDEVCRASPTLAWRQFSRRLCISQQEFLEYLRGCRAATVYKVSEAVKFPRHVPLVKATRLRRPPQSYSYLDRTTSSKVLRSAALPKETLESSGGASFPWQSTLRQWEERASGLEAFGRTAIP